MTATPEEEHDGGSSVRKVTQSSRLVAQARSAGNWVRQSFLYQWLTKEPEPEVIVIDLRETRTVGPFIALIDRVGARLAPWWRESGCRRACAVTGAWLLARPIRAVGVALLAAGAVAFVLTAAGGGPATRTLAVSLGLLVIGAMATRSQHSWQDIQATRSYQLLVAALEPPEPPEQQEDSVDESAQTESETATDTES